MNKKLVDLNFTVLDLNGKEIAGPAEGTHAGIILANILVAKPTGDVLKLFGWAMDLNRRNPLHLDESDYATLLKEVNESTLPILTKAQILKKLNFDNAEKCAEKC